MQNTQLPLIKCKGKYILESFDDVVAVSFDTYIVAEDFTECFFSDDMGNVWKCKGDVTFEQLNIDWNAEPNAPEVNIEVHKYDVILEFYLNAFKYEQFSEEDRARITFHNCYQYRYGLPNDEGFYVYNQSRFKKYGVKWGEFYLAHGTNWKEEFPDPIVVDGQAGKMKHYIFYFRDGTFECIAESYDIEFITEN